MNVIHDTGIAVPRNTAVLRLGPFARDLLALVWAHSGITVAAAGTTLGEHRRTSNTMFNLRRQGVVQEHPGIVGGRRVVRWCVCDAALAQTLLEAPERGKLRDSNQPWQRCIPNPDFSQPPLPLPALDPEAFEPELRARHERASLAASNAHQRLLAQAEEEAAAALDRRRRLLQPPLRARQEPPSFTTCDATRHLPVVRAGSLDALRLRSLRWGTDRGTPEVRMAVVEAKGSAS